MLYVVVERQGSSSFLSYRFVVKNLPKKTVLDNIGWYSTSFRVRRDEISRDLMPCFLCLNYSKLFLWGLKRIKFKKKAYNLIFGTGFLNKNIFLNKKWKKNI